MSKEQIRTGFAGGLLRVDLNRPEAINSLNLSMVTSLWRVFREADQDDSIKAILLTGVGEKGFCAGGDVKSVVQNSTEILNYAQDFFQFEYLVDDYIYEMKKPVICLAHGICMGGGLGLFMAASHRVATSTCRFAMPETAIGFFPDVGASFFLNKVWKKPYSHFFALSGESFLANDGHFINCCEYVIDQQNYMQLVDQIINSDWSSDPKKNHEICSEAIEDFHQEQKSELHKIESDLIEIFSQNDLSSCLDLWKKKAESSDLLKAGLEKTLKASPLAVALTYRLLREDWSRSESAVRDWDLALQHCKGSDFHEGVRALLIDKDKSPKWQHASTSDVPQKTLNELFEAVPNNPLADYFSATK